MAAALVAGPLIYGSFANIASLTALVGTVAFLAVAISAINLIGPWLFSSLRNRLPEPPTYRNL